MLLASVREIREGLGFDDMTNINADIAMSLDAAEPVLAAALNTTFARAEATDAFWVPEPTVIDGPHRKTEFWLSRCFIVGTPVVTGFDFADGALIYDREKGVVKDRTSDYANSTVEFTYTYGFELSEAEEGNPFATRTYDLTQVPTWLQEAAKMLAMINLSDAASITEAGIKIDPDIYQRQLQALMQTRIRYAPMALIPL